MSHLWFPSRHTVWRQLWALQWLFCTSWLVPNPVVRLLAEQKGTPSYFTHVSCFKGLRTTEAWHISGHCVNRCPRTCWTRTAGHSLILLSSFQHFNCTDWSCMVLLHSKPFWTKWGSTSSYSPKAAEAGQWLHPWLLPGLEFAILLWTASIIAVTMCPVSSGIGKPLCVQS